MPVPALIDHFFKQIGDPEARLDKSGRPTRLIELEDEGHSGWREESERVAMTAIGEFLRLHIGPGNGQATENRQ
jgi:hypothetical protein